jgi:hypothetical protein
MGPEVHMRRTYAWAVEAGFDHAEAEVIARADVEYDATFPARRSAVNITRHFAPTAWLWSAHYFRKARTTRDLRLLGWALHTAQDAIAHGTLGERHLLDHAGLGRNPDHWEIAPAGIQRRIERVTRDRLDRFLGVRA